jgi:outer membrane protein insertion porin family
MRRAAALLLAVTAGCRPAPTAPAVEVASPASQVPPAPPAAECGATDESPAPDPEALARSTIALVCFRGHAQLREETLRGLLGSREGRAYDAHTVATDIRQLFDTGMIEDVQVRAHSGGEGVVLTFAIVERKLASRVRFEGARAIGDEDLRTAFHASEHMVLDPARISRGTRDLRQEYTDRGYLYSKVTTRTARAAEGGVELVVVIDEGPNVKVSSLAFAGAKSIPEANLKKLAATKVGEAYRAPILERDLLQIASVYYDHGMIQAAVGVPEVTPSPDKQSVAVRVPVTEGPVFRLRAIKLAGDVAGQEGAYRTLIDLKTGQVFDRSKLVAALAAIRDLRRRQGRGDSVEPVTEIDPSKHQIDLTVTLK